MAKKISIFVSADGKSARSIYTDNVKLKDIFGNATVERASNVEPDIDGNWTADMSLVTKNQTMLGPFPTRKEALDKEVEFLKDNLRNSKI